MKMAQCNSRHFLRRRAREIGFFYSFNAVYHRSYEEREPVEVRVYADQLVVLSYPGPDRSVQLDQLRRGRAMARRYRNRRIGEFLKELSLTEGRSTGIPKILRAMAANGSPPPEFETDPDHSYFQVRLPVHPQAQSGIAKVGAGETAGEQIQLPTQLPTQSGDPVERLLIALTRGEQSSGDLREALGIRHRPTFRENYLHPALNQGLIEYTLPDKPSSRLQRYRLTDQGRTVLAGLSKGQP